MSVGELPALRLRPDFEIQSLTLADGVLTMSMADGSRFVAPEEAVAAIARPQLPGCRMVLQIWIGPAKMPYVLLARDLPDAPTRAALSGLMDRLIARCRARLAAGEAIQGDGWILRPDAFVIADPWQPITVPRAAIAGVKLDPAGVHLISYASEAHGLLFGQGGRLLDVLGPLLGWVDTPVATRRAIRPADPLKQMPHETLSIEHTAKQISPATIAPPPPVPTAFAHPHAGASSNYNAAPSYASGSSLNAAMRAGLSGGSRSASQYAAPNAYTAPNSYAAATGYRSPVRAKPSHGVELAPGLVLLAASSAAPVTSNSPRQIVTEETAAAFFNSKEHVNPVLVSNPEKRTDHRAAVVASATSAAIVAPSEPPVALRGEVDPEMGRLLHDQTTPFVGGTGWAIYLGVLLIALIVYIVKSAMDAAGEAPLADVLDKMFVLTLLAHLWEEKLTWLPWVAGAIGFALFLLLLPSRRLRLYEEGVRATGGLASDARLHVSEMRSMAYAGPATISAQTAADGRFTLKFTLTNGRVREFSGEHDAGLARTLIAARDQLAWRIGWRMVERLEANEAVRWTRTLALAPEGLMMHQALIPYDKIERSAFVARDKGRWSAFVDGRLLVQEDPSVDNFFPGLFAFEAMRLPPA